MKRIIANASSLMLAVLLFTAAGFAQQLVVQADVPFEFSVGQKTFPAGEYRIAQVAPQILALRNNNNGLLAVIMTSPTLSLASRVNPKLRFELADGRSVLSEVWAGDTTGYKLFVPKRLPALTQSQPESPELQNTTLSSVGK